MLCPPLVAAFVRVIASGILVVDGVVRSTGKVLTPDAVKQLPG